MNEELNQPPEALLELGLPGIVVFGVLMLAAMIIAYLVASKRAGKGDPSAGSGQAPLGLLILLPLLLLLAGCVSYPASDYVALDRANYEATAPLLEDLIENARRDHSATAMLPEAIEQASALLALADEAEDPADANALRLQAAAVLRDATTTKYFPPEEAAIWRDGLATWLARLEAAEAMD